MEQITIAIIKTITHITKNLSNYCLLIGLFFIGRYIFIKYGIDTLLLNIGVLLIFLSFVLEISKNNIKKIR